MSSKTHRSQGKATEEFRVEKGVILHLEGNLCNNHGPWRDFIITHIGMNYPESKGYMEAGIAHVDLVLSESDYVTVPGTPLWQRERINKDREIRLKFINEQNDKMRRQKIAICAFIISKLSVASLLAVKSHVNFRTACPIGQDAVGNPYELMQIISERHFIVNLDKDSNPEARRDALRSTLASMKLEERESPVELVMRINEFKEQEVMFYNNPANHMPLLVANGAQQMVPVPIISPNEYVFMYMRLTSKLFPEAHANWQNTMRSAPFDSVNSAYEYCNSFKVPTRLGVSSVLSTTVKRRRDDSSESEGESSGSGSYKKKVHFKGRRRSNSMDSLSSRERKEKRSKSPQIPSGPCRNCERHGLTSQVHWISLCPLKQESSKTDDDKELKRKKV